VNEASTIIQNAAHEDANIIFGAVQDETMGDDVKITVIATGFKQDMPQRRERMLSEAMLPTVRYDVAGLNVPIRPRADVKAEVAPPVEKFVSEPVEAPAPAPVVERAEQPAIVESVRPVEPPTAAPELIPVKASVFDDDFFKTPVPRFGDARVAETPKVEPPVAVVRNVLGVADVQAMEARVTPPTTNFPAEGYAAAVSTELPRSTSFTGKAATEAEPSEPDELDIPAFLRRGNAQ